MPRQKHIQLHVDSPCTQAWSEMRPEGNGRFCDHCQKTVVDYTQMSDRDIVKSVLAQTTSGCGRFRSQQLSRPIVVVEPTSSRAWPSLAAAVLLSLLGMPHALLAQTPSGIGAAVTQNTSATERERLCTRSGSFYANKDSMFVLKGHLIDAETGEAITNGSLGNANLRLHCMVHENGRFVLYIPPRLRHAPLKLYVASQGDIQAITINMPLNQLSMEVNIALHFEPSTRTGLFGIRGDTEEVEPTVETKKKRGTKK